MSIQGIPTPDELADDILIFGGISRDGITAHAVRRSTHDACCCSCGGHSRLDLQDVGNGMRALLCCACRDTFLRHVETMGGDIAAC